MQNEVAVVVGAVIVVVAVAARNFANGRKVYQHQANESSRLTYWLLRMELMRKQNKKLSFRWRGQQVSASQFFDEFTCSLRVTAPRLFLSGKDHTLEV